MALRGEAVGAVPKTRGIQGVGGDEWPLLVGSGHSRPGVGAVSRATVARPRFSAARALAASNPSDSLGPPRKRC